MAGFKAATAVDPFEYDLAPFVSDAKGTTPEPPDDVVRRFYARLGSALKDALGERVADVDLNDPAEVRRIMSGLTEDDMAVMQETMLTLHADVCQGYPSRDQLAQLPYRLKQAFYGALQTWLSPEASRPAGKN